MKKYVLTLLFVVLGFVAFPAIITSTGNGNWCDTATWDLGRTPTNNDTIQILQGDTVTVNCFAIFLDSVQIDLSGQLQFQGNNRISLTSNGTVNVYPSGTFTGGSTWAALRIGLTYVYSVRFGINTSGMTTCNSSGCVPNTALPIELLSLNAELEDDILTVRWVTASEINNDYVDVQTSFDGKQWAVRETVEGQGNSNQIREYEVSFKYDLIYVYVRLAQYDYDGSVEFSKLVYAEQIKNVNDLVWLEVFTINGSKVSNWEYGLNPGMYIIKHQGGYFKYVQP